MGKLSSLPVNSSPVNTDYVVGINGTPTDSKYPLSGIFALIQGNYPTKRNNNGSTVTEATAKIETGWADATTGAASAINISITFPTAFTSAPIVLASFGGDTIGASSTYGSGTSARNNAWAEAINITNTGFTLRVASTSNWTSGDTVYGQWIAIGV